MARSMSGVSQDRLTGSQGSTLIKVAVIHPKPGEDAFMGEFDLSKSLEDIVQVSTYLVSCKEQPRADFDDSTLSLSLSRHYK